MQQKPGALPSKNGAPAAEPSWAEPLDPVALERRLAVARERRAAALAGRAPATTAEPASRTAPEAAVPKSAAPVLVARPTDRAVAPLRSRPGTGRWRFGTARLAPGPVAAAGFACLIVVFALSEPWRLLGADAATFAPTALLGPAHLAVPDKLAPPPVPAPIPALAGFIPAALTPPNVTLAQAASAAQRPLARPANLALARRAPVTLSTRNNAGRVRYTGSASPQRILASVIRDLDGATSAGIANALRVLDIKPLRPTPPKSAKSQREKGAGRGGKSRKSR